MRPAAPVQTRPAPAAASPRSRAKLIDDDLFDFDAPVAAPRPVLRAAPELPVHAPQARAAQAAMASTPRMADPEPVVEAPRPADRFAREAFYREMLERDARERELIQDNFAPEAFADEPSSSGPARDPFESGRFANERRAMLAAVMGGRR